MIIFGYMIGNKSKLSEAFGILEDKGWLSERSKETSVLLKSIARLQIYEDDQPVFLAGDYAEYVFCVVSGALRCFLPLGDTTEYLGYLAGPGSWIGHLPLFAQKPYNVSCWTKGETQLVVLPKVQLENLLEEHPILYRDIIALHYKSFEETFSTVNNFAFETTIKRVASRLLIVYHEIAENDDWMALTQEELGEMLAMSLPSVQRALHRLANLNLVQLGYRRIRILDHDQMTDFLEAAKI
jgi:CRP/FNR family cyclic AMP-dependent transcriptional regulator